MVGTRDERSMPSVEARSAWRASVFGAADVDESDELFSEAREVALAAGAMFHPLDVHGNPVLGLVVVGLLRVKVVSPDGRQVTVRYISPGQLAGLASVFAPASLAERPHPFTQAATDSCVLRLSPRRFMEVAGRHPHVWRAVLAEVVTSLVDSNELLADNVFFPLRRRVARHLLELAVHDGDALVVLASQQEIADSVATSREVVSRVMLSLRDESLIRRRHNRYEIIDPDALGAVAGRTGPTVTGTASGGPLQRPGGAHVSGAPAYLWARTSPERA